MENTVKPVLENSLHFLFNVKGRWHESHLLLGMKWTDIETMQPASKAAQNLITGFDGNIAALADELQGSNETASLYIKTAELYAEAVRGSHNAETVSALLPVTALTKDMSAAFEKHGCPILAAACTHFWLPKQRQYLMLEDDREIYVPRM